MEVYTGMQGVAVSRGMIESMRAIRPWTKFLSILGFISVGLMVILGGGVVVLSNVLHERQGGPPAAMGLLYVLFSAFYLFPAIYLYRYSSSLGRFLESNGAGDLEAAFTHQRSFWKFVGIFALIGLVLGALGIVAAIVVPVMLKSQMHGV